MNVGAGAEPAGDSLRSILDGHGSDEMRAVGLPAPIQQPEFHLEWSAALDGSHPALLSGWGVGGVKDLRPARIAQGFRQAGEFAPTTVHVVDVAIRSCGPHDLRHGVGKLAETLLALTQ